FDAIVGNPPYQSTTNGGIDTGKAAKQAKPIFNLFVDQAKKLNSEYVSMIIPARWYNGGMNLDDFRDSMIHDKHLIKLVDFYNAKECFPTVEIAGGLCYFLWSKGQTGDCEITNIVSSERNTMERSLDEFGNLFVRTNVSIPIIKKVLSKTDRFLDELVSPLDTFGIPSKEKGHEKYKDGDIELLHSVGFNSQGFSYIERSKVKKNVDLIDKYKIKISILVAQGGETGVQPENGYRCISGPMILKPGQIDSFSYLNVGFFDTENEATNFLNFLTGKFARYMMRTTFSSVHLSKGNFIFVPYLDFTRPWTDKDLYDLYDLSEDERKLVEKTIRRIDLSE
nr:Eco57I restriction-modification methylase domain-containing protein [Lachnospiraceae bacterium]